MSKIIFSFLAWLSAVAIVIAVLLWLFSLRMPVGVSKDSTPAGAELTVSKPDYELRVPATWHAEESGGSSLTVYPDYDARPGAQAKCKIEISVLLNYDSVALEDWLGEIGRASCRERVEISVVPVSLKKKKIT